MSDVAERQTEGWFWPTNARKAHYYGPDNRSLCGKWFVMHIPQYDGDANSAWSRDDCAGCRKKLDARAGAVPDELD